LIIGGVTEQQRAGRNAEMGDRNTPGCERMGCTRWHLHALKPDKADADWGPNASTPNALNRGIPAYVTGHSLRLGSTIQYLVSAIPPTVNLVFLFPVLPVVIPNMPIFVL